VVKILNAKKVQVSINNPKMKTGHLTRRVKSILRATTQREIRSDFGELQMQITRRGARADNGPSSIELESLQISVSDGNIVLRDNDVSDFVTRAHYNYTMNLSMDELGSIIDALVSAAGEDKKRVADYLGSTKLKELLQLVKMAIEP
jgi:hypothetical protein